METDAFREELRRRLEEFGHIAGVTNSEHASHEEVMDHVLEIVAEVMEENGILS